MPRAAVRMSYISLSVISATPLVIQVNLMIFAPGPTTIFSKIRRGKSTNKFNIHVHNCAKKTTMSEPFFKAYIFMVVSDYNKLLNLERKLHLAGHDTLNR